MIAETDDGVFHRLDLIQLRVKRSLRRLFVGGVDGPRRFGGFREKRAVRRVVVHASVLKQRVCRNGRSDAISGGQNDHFHFRVDSSIGGDAFGLGDDLSGDDIGALSRRVEIVGSGGEFGE